MENTLVVFALAMSWDRERDKLRLQMLLNQRPCTRVVTFSDNLRGCGSMPHVHCTFSTQKGQKSIADRAQYEKKMNPGAPLIIVLDYYWLHQGYYCRYGLNRWLQCGLLAVLQAGADRVLLPNDAGTKNSARAQGAQGSALSAGLDAGRCPLGVTWRYVAAEENPLWRGSDDDEIKEMLAKMPGGDNALATQQFLHPDRPFVEFTLDRLCLSVSV